ncbi:hypothetical protein F3Y22_tig00116976pilonHSYRG00157 [Hibiscus syriacus]|uniref:Uncharacterized protein n=1 Tax=Hibiscus syriacus TaxID=106335 RepID=A0A6A2WGB8_HIBSY|nr:hypothetical protein F3Y22_tig00116976pilonHSYRG00157 [Hibiscus syriacus]
MRWAPTPRIKPSPRKSRRGSRFRSSQYRGVIFYRRTGRWESPIWGCGKQVYLGGIDTTMLPPEYMIELQSSSGELIRYQLQFE